MHQPAFARAIAPLLDAEEIDAFEWSFDAGECPEWMGALIEHASREKRLYGHGVHFSPLSASSQDKDERWLGHLAECAARTPFVHVSEHFGFSCAGRVTRGAPMPLPFCEGALETGRERLSRVHEAARVPVGLENLALAFGVKDVMEQGAFVDALLPSGGWVLLDLHNLWCQSLNFGIPRELLFARWPLTRVRELHVSGGRFSRVKSDPRPFRRDTHDSSIPAEVLEWLGFALRVCPNIEVVIVERLGETFVSSADEQSFAADVRAVRAIVAARAPAEAITAATITRPAAADRVTLAALQSQLVERCAAAPDPSALRDELRRGAHPALAPWLDSLETRALEIAIELAARWGQTTDSRAERFDGE